MRFPEPLGASIKYVHAYLDASIHRVCTQNFGHPFMNRLAAELFHRIHVTSLCQLFYDTPSPLMFTYFMEAPPRLPFRLITHLAFRTTFPQRSPQFSDAERAKLGGRRGATFLPSPVRDLFFYQSLFIISSVTMFFETATSSHAHKSLDIQFITIHKNVVIHEMLRGRQIHCTAATLSS